MNDVRDEHLSHGVTAVQVKTVAHHLRYFLLWVLFACSYNIFIYYSYFDQLSYYYNVWLIGTAIVIILGSILTRVLTASKNVSTFNLDAWCQLICLIVGACIGIGVAVINRCLVIENSKILDSHLIVLTGLLLCISYIMAIVYLAQRLRYFLFVFIPSAIPILFSKLFFDEHVAELYNYIFYVWFTVILISAIFTNRIHIRMNTLNYHNAFYLEQSRKHLKASTELQKQLQVEVQKSKEIENALQLNNQLLEQKVQERTYDISKIKDRLVDHQANLNFAHEAAGIHSWFWNIEKRMVEISGRKSEVQVIQYDNKLEQIDLLIHPEDRENYNQLMRKHLRGFSERFEATYRIEKDQQWSWIEDIGKVIARDAKTNKPLRMVGIHRNIEQERKDQEQLKLAANVFNHVAQGVFVLDNNLCFLEVNPFFSELIAMDSEDIVGKHLFDVTNNTILEVSTKHADVTQQVLLTGTFDAELQEEFISGKNLILWLHINAVRDDHHKVINYVGVVTDLTERRKHEKRLAYLENYDLLTDLPNRVYYNLQLHHYLVQKSKSFNHIAVIRLNIDRFRHFNELLSNQAGDELLKQVSKRLKQICSDALLISYLNNDDFAVIYNLNTSRHLIYQKVEELVQSFNQAFPIHAQEHYVSTSIGIAIYPEHGRQMASLNSHAEIALSEAKKLGGNTFSYYNNKSNAEFDNDIQFEDDLRKAIKNNQLEVYYQPKICYQNMRPYGFEALIRWKHPEYGVITPDYFLSIAEASSLISEIGQFVIFQVCQQIQIWKKLGFDQICVSINVVAQQVHRGQLLNDIDTALNQYDLSTDNIQIELTESSLLDKSQHVIDLLNQIKQRKISIALDDFGTGYSSLAYLADYPIDTLKIDKAFVSKIGNSKDEAIVNAIIAMGKAMGMSLIAEGVETEAQIEYLKNRGCELFQGYYFSKPLTASESTQYLSNEKVTHP